MLIKALDEYYSILSNANKVCQEGFSKVDVHYMIFLNLKGEITDIVNIEQNVEMNNRGKNKKLPLSVILPKRVEKTMIYANIIEHRPLYIFGLDYSNAYGSFITSYKAYKSNESFRKINLEFIEGMSSDIVTAYRNFIQTWNPEHETNNKFLLQIGKKYKNVYFVFALEGHPEITLHDKDGEISRKNRNNDENTRYHNR